MSSNSDGAAGSRALLRDSLSDVVQGTQMLEILHSLKALSLGNALKNSHHNIMLTWKM